MSDGARLVMRHSAFGVRAAVVVVLALVAMSVVPTSARAQLLDLDRPLPTEPGEVRAALRYADVIEQDASAFSDSPLDRARGAIRALAAALIRTGDDRAEAGSNRVVIGMSLVRGLDELDAAITSAALNDADRARLSSDLELLAASLPDDADDLDRALRDALAVLLLARNVSGGWHNYTIDGSPLAPKTERWLADELITDQTALDLADFDAMLASAAYQPGYARSASWLRNRINFAARGIDELPDWMPEDSVASLKASFDAGLAALCADSGNDDAAATLDGIFYLSGACRRVPMIKSDRVAQSVRDSLISAADDPGSAREVYGPTDNLIVTLDAFDRPIPQPRVRQLRPAGRAMMGRTRRLRTDLESAIADSLNGGARSDPAALSLIARANRFSADSRLINRLDTLLAPAGDTRDEWRADAAQRILSITREMSDEQSQGDAFVRLRTVGEQMDLTKTIRRFADQLDPPQAELESEFDILTDGRTVQLSAMLLRLVTRAERSLVVPAQPIPNNAIGLELKNAARQIALIDDVLLVRSIVDPHDPNKYALAAVPAWGLSRDDLRVLIEPIESSLIRVNTALLDGDDQIRAALLPATEQEASLVRLIALLERRARGRYADMENAHSVFARVALGAPMPDSWMSEHRGRLAAISRYATELASAQRFSDQDEHTIDTLDEYVRFEAMRLLNELD